MSLTAAQLRTFSRCVLNLPDPTEAADPEAWLLMAVTALRSLVAFDSAWWGQVDAAHPGGMARNVMHGSLGLSPHFAEEWNAIARSDDFARTSMDRLGEAIVHNHSTDDLEPGGSTINDFARRHGLHHCLAVTLQFRSSGLLFFISIYRDHSRPAFTRTDALWLEEYSAHLLKGWVRCLQLANHGRFRNHWDRVALANSTGRILYIGKLLSHALKERFDDWQGTFLPSLLTETLPTPRGSPYRRDRSGLTVQPCGKLASLTLSREEDRMPPPRELSAALLYAQGQSYKEVARSLGVTPATVRTYLRQVYGQLGVSNKVALATALQSAGYETGAGFEPGDRPG